LSDSSHVTVAQSRRRLSLIGHKRGENKKTGRYGASHLPEAQFEPGSRGKVLKNLLGIKRKNEMDEVEAREQLRALRDLIAIYDEAHVFTAADLCKIHRTWLGPIYSWAGEYRQVNISKDEFPFAAAREILKLITGVGMTIDLFIDFRWDRILNFEVRQNLRRPVFVLRQFHQRSSRIVQVSDGPQT
jgi:hypothetical protein